MKSEIRFYATVLLKRLPIVILFTGIATAAAVYVAMTTPATYEAEALLLVESPQIPDNLAASTVASNAPEQLDIIQQRLLTRANLLDIANQLNVFPNRGSMVPDDGRRQDARLDILPYAVRTGPRHHAHHLVHRRERRTSRRRS
jgi:hypothetical protein